MGAASVQAAFNSGNAIDAYAGGIPIDSGLGYRSPALVGACIVPPGFASVPFCIRRKEKKQGGNPVPQKI